VVNRNVASASVSLHMRGFMALYKFVFNFNLTLTYQRLHAVRHAVKADEKHYFSQVFFCTLSQKMKTSNVLIK